MITTPEGNVVVDTGFAFQAKKQYKLLREVNDAPITHILIPQGQFDDIAGFEYWKGESTKVIMTRATAEYMPWRAKVQTGQENPVQGKEGILESLILIRDSVQYVHDEVSKS